MLQQEQVQYSAINVSNMFRQAYIVAPLEILLRSDSTARRDHKLYEQSEYHQVLREATYVRVQICVGGGDAIVEMRMNYLNKLVLSKIYFLRGIYSVWGNAHARTS